MLAKLRDNGKAEIVIEHRKETTSPTGDVHRSVKQFTTLIGCQW